VTGTPFVKNYEFDYDFGIPWGRCSVVFTAVAGHIMKEDFPQAYGWNKCDPAELFDAPIERTVDEVSSVIDLNRS
jgi:DNA topoisomerase III